MLGFRQATGDFIGFVDADGATPPEAFQELVEHIGPAGGIIASRWAKGSKVSPRQPLDRRVASRIFNLVTRILFGLRLTDTQCGAKLMTREAVQAILPHLGVTQWAFDVDLLFQLRRAGYVIKEIPTTWHDVEGSKIQVGKASTEMMMAMVRLRLMYSPFKWVVEIYNRFLGPWIHPEGTVRDYLLTHSLMLFLGAQFGNICNLLFQVIMARMLGNADYGELFAILSALMLLGAPLGALGGAVTHFTSLFMVREERGKIKAMMGVLAGDMLIPVLLILFGCGVARQELMGAFKLASPWPVYIAGATAVVMLLGAVPGGVLAGMQAFEWAALIGNGWTVIRLGLGIILVLCGMGAVGGLLAHMAGILVSALLSLMICGSLLGVRWASLWRQNLPDIRNLNRSRKDAKNSDIDSAGGGKKHSSLASSATSEAYSERPAGVYSYMGGYLVAFTAFGVLSSADVLLVKYYFPPAEAGLFAKAAMVARIVFFLPGPVCSAMFPKVSTTGESSGATRRTLNKALVVTGVLVSAMGLVCLAFPAVLLKLLAKESQPGQVEILRGMVLALAPLTLVTVLLNYELAQRRFRIMIPLLICAGGYLLGVRMWHETLMQVVGVLGMASVVALLFAGLVAQGVERHGKG